MNTTNNCEISPKLSRKWLQSQATNAKNSKNHSFPQVFAWGLDKKPWSKEQGGKHASTVDLVESFQGPGSATFCLPCAGYYYLGEGGNSGKTPVQARQGYLHYTKCQSQCQHLFVDKWQHLPHLNTIEILDKAGPKSGGGLSFKAQKLGTKIVQLRV